MSTSSAPDNSTAQVFWHDDVLGHDTGQGVFEHANSDLLDEPELHPENATRVVNMRSVLKRGPIADRLMWKDGRHATPEELATVHTPEHVTWALETLGAGPLRLPDESTVIGKGTLPAALAAAGTALEAADAVLSGETKVAFALVRPPGHHAQPDQADGYCFFNNAALAAQRARDAGRQRVAIVDWDVHHGNGTQACFYERSDVLTISLHQRTGLWGPTHVQMGTPEEVGVHDGQGFNVNVELPAGSGDVTYSRAMRDVVVPVLEQFKPDLIVGAVGQDASAFDPNGRQNVSMDGFRDIGYQLREAAERLCDGEMVLLQEGGYGRTYAAFCLHATLEGLLGVPEPLLEEELAYMTDDRARARESVDFVITALSRYWSFPL